MTTSTKRNLLIIFGVIVLWIIIGGITSWNLWIRYQDLTEPDASQLQQSTVELEGELVESALEAIRGN